tara:strand:- start:173 stop:766 length:594 start_codon:yes stop_codon:yes gene_type:complete
MKIEGFTQEKILGPLIFTPNIFEDERGYFFESWNKKQFLKFTEKSQETFMQKNEINFVQDNQSFSSKNVLRGLHYQVKPYAQGKLVSCIAGEIFDVVVDLRKDSPSFGKWAGLVLSGINLKQLWIPEGFAHGFLSLKENTKVLYKTTNYWNKEAERSLKWNDPLINIKWPLFKLNPIVSKKDSLANSLNKINKDDLF